MKIHVVAPGENINSIALLYGVTPQSIVNNNAIEDPKRLVPGQTLVILIPEITHTVKEGDTLFSISQLYGVSELSILQNNPIVSVDGLIFPGEILAIKYTGEKRRTISTNGYMYPNIDRSVLRRTLPYLTYLTIFTYGFTADGQLLPVEDEEILAIAKQYDVVPVMALASLGPDGQFSNELISNLLNNEQAQTDLIAQILQTMNAKGYKVVDLDLEYIPAEDADNYITFVEKLRTALSPFGYQVFISLAPKVSATQPGLLYEAHNYPELGALADSVLLMTYEWGYTYGPPMAIAPINKVEQVVQYAVTEITPSKINLGMPNYAYDWTLPFKPGVSMARAISSTQAVELAGNVGATIEFDTIAQSPFYSYYDVTGSEHEVWFEDARSVQAKLDLVEKYGLNGISFWQIMRFFPQSWLVINGLYDIQKFL